MRPRERLAAAFPMPFVGVAVLLLLLILVTPNLLSAGPPTAGSLSATADFVVDRVPNSNLTHVYIYGLSSVRYTVIHLRIASNVTWPAPSSPVGFNWSRSVLATNALVLAYATPANPVAFNVTAVYTDAAGASVAYTGAFELDFLPPTLYVIGLTPGLPRTTTETITATSEPLNFLLVSGPVGAT
ncbi:MAG: hypothetical protein L3K15_04300 [Thermoplasmata archaeon]|nr:hypothetical protein [Thermoplasmata archaeon]